MAKRHGKNSKKNPPSPTMLLSKMLPRDLMRSAVLGFLDRASVASLMAVKELSQVFRLRSCFCKDHGTRLGQVCPRMPTGTKNQCADCEMPKIGMTRCGKCDEFERTGQFCYCNICDKSECRDCMFFCVDCYEVFCSECKDPYQCEGCKHSSCLQCKNEKMFVCTQCDKILCNGCNDLASCEVCKTAFCTECKVSFYCEECEEGFCLDCEAFFDCSHCEGSFCLDCRKWISCNDECENKFCTLGCKEMYACCSPKGETLSSEVS
jgi:hypothetical protein